MNKPLTKAEEQVMQVLWRLGSAYLKDIVEAMPEPKPHSNTIATIIKILIDKGYISHKVH
ncbi:MAG: BlaI/MecI/CopY family transcriptional regulator, partial [bacterium]